MKREIQVGRGMQLASSATLQDGSDASNIGDAIANGARNAREEVRRRQPRGAFDARAIRELSQAVPTDQRLLRRTIRRNELRQIVPVGTSLLVIGEIVHVHIDPAIWARGRVQAAQLNPVARLGGSQYAVLGEIFNRTMPVVNEREPTESG